MNQIQRMKSVVQVARRVTLPSRALRRGFASVAVSGVCTVECWLFDVGYHCS